MYLNYCFTQYSYHDLASGSCIIAGLLVLTHVTTLTTAVTEIANSFLTTAIIATVEDCGFGDPCFFFFGVGGCIAYARDRVFSWFRVT